MGFPFNSWILTIAGETGKRKQRMDAIKWKENHYCISSSLEELCGCARLNSNCTQIIGQIVCCNTGVCWQPGMSYYKGQGNELASSFPSWSSNQNMDFLLTLASNPSSLFHNFYSNPPGTDEDKNKVFLGTKNVSCHYMTWRPYWFPWKFSKAVSICPGD